MQTSYFAKPGIQENPDAVSILILQRNIQKPVIPAKAGIQKNTGCRIKSGMTEFLYLIAGLIALYAPRWWGKGRRSSLLAPTSEMFKQGYAKEEYFKLLDQGCLGMGF